MRSGRRGGWGRWGRGGSRRPRLVLLSVRARSSKRTAALVGAGTTDQSSPPTSAGGKHGCRPWSAARDFLKPERFRLRVRGLNRSVSAPCGLRKLLQGAGCGQAMKEAAFW